MEATELFENAIAWLQGRYADFYREIENQGLPYRVFNDHTILPRIRADLAILKGDSIEVAEVAPWGDGIERVRECIATRSRRTGAVPEEN